jgi:hypothetical protein
LTRFETKKQAEQLYSKFFGKTGSNLKFEEREVSFAAAVSLQVIKNRSFEDGLTPKRETAKHLSSE